MSGTVDMTKVIGIRRQHLGDLMVYYREHRNNRSPDHVAHARRVIGAFFVLRARGRCRGE